MLMTKAKMEKLVEFRKNIEYVQGLLEKLEEASKAFTQDDGITYSYIVALKMDTARPLRSIKMLHMRVTEIEKEQNGGG